MYSFFHGFYSYFSVIFFFLLIKFTFSLTCRFISIFPLPFVKNFTFSLPILCKHSHFRFFPGFHLQFCCLKTNTCSCVCATKIIRFFGRSLILFFSRSSTLPTKLFNHLFSVVHFHHFSRFI